MDKPARVLSADERRDWLRLIRSENVGPIGFFQLLRLHGSAAEALRALPELSRRGGRIRPVAVCSRHEAEREMEALGRIGASLLALGEENYPPALAAIPDPPPLLAVRGHPHLFRCPVLAVVGARNASANGIRFARRIAAELGSEGFIIVSGLARGIDASAHQGALETGTVAVMAGGVDVVYPSENAELFDRIVAVGAAAAEQSPGTVAQARHFPRRNRIISGMSLGVLVVEATARSGSLITARLALDQGREVFAVPGSPLDPRARGTNNLIRQGAALTESAEDVVTVLRDMIRAPLTERREEPFGDLPAELPSEAEVTEARRCVVERLAPTPVAVDEIVRQCQVTPALVLTVLLELELAGRLQRHPGNQVFLIVSE
ncbi:MAG: DNA-processing protein DprA [Alphaproteobacteria bacterium]